MSQTSIREIARLRNILFALVLTGLALALRGSLRSVAGLASASGEYSYIALIPLIVVILFYVERKRVFRDVHYSPRTGGLVILLGVAASVAAVAIFPAMPGAGARLFLEILGLAVISIGAFVFFYGGDAARAGRFPLLFTLLLVPLPNAVIDAPIELVRYGSANVTSALFTLFGLPVFREGLVFSLPHLDFFVAKECSGIHSTTALVIACLLGGHFYLKASWKKVLLVALSLPIVCFTNGLRMFVLATLAVYVNPAFFQGNLHRKGGILFFTLGLLLLGLATRALRSRAGQQPRALPEAVPSSPGG